MDFTRNWHKHYPPGVNQALNIEKITMPEFLTRAAKRFPDRAALVFMGKKISYREIETMVNRFAAALTAIGVKPGDKVAMLLPNMPQTIIAQYAALRIGAVAMMNDPLCDEHELIDRLKASESKVLITLDLLFPRALETKASTGIQSIIACHINDFLPFPGNWLLPYISRELFCKIPQQSGIHEFLTILNRYPDTPTANAAGWEDPATLLYTGATTGTSKGVLLTHANISSSAQQLRTWFSNTEDGRESVLAVFPFFHPFGYTCIQNLSILAGWTVILVPRPDPQTVVDIMKNQQPTLFTGTPWIYSDLLARESFQRMNLSSIKAFLSGTAPLSVDVIRRLKTIKDVPVISIYGSAETCSIGTATLWHGDEKPETAGLPLPGIDLKIVDSETGANELATGAPGEICFCGPQIMQGYHRETEATAAALKDGWFYTGDVGFLDTDGYLTLLERKNERIAVSESLSVSPREIDDILFQHPKILDVCTIGMPAHPNEIIKSYIVLRPQEKADPEEIIEYCRERLESFKIPKNIEFIEKLPKNAVGLTLRYALKRLGNDKHQEKT